jgi:hypothetical protein
MTFRFKQAADLLGVSDDTSRRWADGGRFATTVEVGGRRAVDLHPWPWPARTRYRRHLTYPRPASPFGLDLWSFPCAVPSLSPQRR